MFTLRPLSIDISMDGERRRVQGQSNISSMDTGPEPASEDDAVMDGWGSKKRAERDDNMSSDDVTSDDEDDAPLIPAGKATPTLFKLLKSSARALPTWQPELSRSPLPPSPSSPVQTALDVGAPPRSPTSPASPSRAAHTEEAPAHRGLGSSPSTTRPQLESSTPSLCAPQDAPSLSSSARCEQQADPRRPPERDVEDLDGRAADMAEIEHEIAERQAKVQEPNTARPSPLHIEAKQLEGGQPLHGAAAPPPIAVPTPLRSLQAAAPMAVLSTDDDALPHRSGRESLVVVAMADAGPDEEQEQDTEEDDDEAGNEGDEGDHGGEGSAGGEDSAGGEESAGGACAMCSEGEEGMGVEAVESDAAGTRGEWRSCATRDIVELVSDARQQHPFCLPSEVYERLFAYQKAGVAWLAKIWRQGYGGILADEMGLGKTVQVCSFLNGARKAGATHALLLLPVSLLDQWAREAHRWCPGWPVYTYYGRPAQRAHALSKVSLPQGGILLTTYALLGNVECLFEVAVAAAATKAPRRYCKAGAKRRKTDDDDGFENEASEEHREPEMPPTGLPEVGQSRPWDVVVCDEAHRMKSISTLLGRSLRKMRAHCRLLLTGTPVQNALQDLWSLMDFAQPGLLGNHATFVKKFNDPIERGSMRGASPFAVELKNHLAEQLRAVMAPHLLRRTKQNVGLLAADGEEVGDMDAAGDVAMEDAGASMENSETKKLLPKFETIVWLCPSEDQARLYRKILEKSEVIREATAKSKLGIEVFRAIGLLKRLCNHPLLALPCPQAKVWADMMSEVINSASAPTPPGAEADTIEDLAVPEISETDALTDFGAKEANDANAGPDAEKMIQELPRSVEAVLQQSAKLRCLASLLPALASKGHRTLVFSQSVKMLDLILVCVLRPNGLRCLRIDGQTDAASRAEKVAKFQKQVDRFQCLLLTTAVGGVGLNLTSADRVVLVDPSWNPAADAQAVDRAFRIGQEKEVRVYRLIVSGLIEDKMFRLQVFKMGLTKTALEANSKQDYFTAREIRALFDWTDPAEGETRRRIIDKHGKEHEDVVNEGAEADGCSPETWISDKIAIGLSDFGALHSLERNDMEEGKGSACNAQVIEAKEKLNQADEKAQKALQARQAAEANHEQVQQELNNAITATASSAEARSKAEVALKEQRGEFVAARRAESMAEMLLEKASRACTGAQDQRLRAVNAAVQAREAVDCAARTTDEAASALRASDEAFQKSIEDLQAAVAVVDETSGKAFRNDGIVDANVGKLRIMQKALEHLKSCASAAGNRQAELVSCEEELARADATSAAAEEAAFAASSAGEATETAELNARSSENEQERAEQACAQARQSVKEAYKLLLQAIKTLIEAGVAFADSFTKADFPPPADGRRAVVKLEQVKVVQVATRAAFRFLMPCGKQLKSSQEAFAKTTAALRKARQAAVAKSMQQLEAEAAQAQAEQEHADAKVADEARRQERVAQEAAVSAAEKALSDAEAEEASSKRRREELRSALAAARDAIKPTKAAEKEAMNERQALHMAYSKVERSLAQMEEAKSTAIQDLQAEEYDRDQVLRICPEARGRVLARSGSHSGIVATEDKAKDQVTA